MVTTIISRRPMPIARRCGSNSRPRCRRRWRRCVPAQGLKDQAVQQVSQILTKAQRGRFNSMLGPPFDLALLNDGRGPITAGLVGPPPGGPPGGNPGIATPKNAASTKNAATPSAKPPTNTKAVPTR